MICFFKEEVIKMSKRISVALNLLVDLKVGESVDVKNLIERLECSCTDASGEDAKITDVKILDRKLLIESDEGED
jgi:hypothetical protein